jgi:hypothetical protein
MSNTSSIVDILSQAMLKEIQTEIDREFLNTVMNMTMGDIYDEGMMEDYLNYLLKRDFPWLTSYQVHTIAIKGALSVDNLRSVYREQLEGYQIVTKIGDAVNWIKYVLNNYADYKLHLKGIEPDLYGATRI